MKKIIKRGFIALQHALAGAERNRVINVVAPGISPAERAEIETRAAFYLPGAISGLRFHDRLSLGLILSPAPLLFYSADGKVPGYLRIRNGVANINAQVNPRDGWEWCDVANYAEGNAPDLAVSQAILFNYLERTKAAEHQRCYAFGTGPSLARAIERDWSDGYRVVCNTIVRDPELWQHINPHIIVGGDAIYHFGFTEFARAFRRDLVARMAESEAIFVYPAQFDLMVRRELGQFASRLVPIPWGQHTHVHQDLKANFALPALSNILNILLLPVACNISKHVGLWGFDGRGPADKLFWANSSRHSYTELLPVLQAAHPAFFDASVPKDDPEKYVREVHGDVLERCLTLAEQAGWRFAMLHDSYTPTLAKRRADSI